jgi:hypothetical protein
VSFFFSFFPILFPLPSPFFFGGGDANGAFIGENKKGFDEIVEGRGG